MSDEQKDEPVLRIISNERPQRASPQDFSGDGVDLNSQLQGLPLTALTEDDLRNARIERTVEELEYLEQLFGDEDSARRAIVSARVLVATHYVIPPKARRSPESTLSKKKSSSASPNRIGRDVHLSGRQKGICRRPKGSGGIRTHAALIGLRVERASSAPFHLRS